MFVYIYNKYIVMSNVYIMVYSGKFVPNKITSNLVDTCIEYGYVFIGVNSIGKFHTYQYRGKREHIVEFVKKCRNVFSKYSHSIVYNNQELLQKPSENDITFIQDKSLLQYKEYNKKVTTNIIKSKLIFFLSNCYKKDTKYYFTIYYKSLIRGIPKKIFHECYCTIEDNKVCIYSSNSIVSKNIELYLCRLYQLYTDLRK